MTFVIDSCILLDYPQILVKKDFDDEIIILTDVLKELDGLKLNLNSEIAFKARRAAISISRVIKEIKFNDDLENSNEKVDDKLLEIARRHNAILVTNDVYLKIKATVKGIKTKGYGGVNDYTGVYYWIVDVNDNLYNEQLEFLLTTRKPLEHWNLKENQYLIIESQHKDILNIYRHTNGFLEEVITRDIRNPWFDKISPRNPEQICLFDALANPNITIIYAGGGFGVGKSYLLNNMALQELHNNSIKKIIYVPNNSYVQNSLDLGALSDTMFEKITPLIGPLVDLIGIDEINRLISAEQLEIVPINYIRGRNFDNSIILVNEAQNLDEEQVKLLIGRVGVNSKIYFDGSQKQVDSQLFKNKSGLKMLLKIADHSEYSKKFATIELKKIESSETAQIADYLDNLEGILV